MEALSLQGRESIAITVSSQNIHYNKDLQKYYNENGEGSVIFNILKEFEVDSREKIFEVEQAFIEEYESLKRCLNQNKSVRVVKIENFSNFMRTGILKHLRNILELELSWSLMDFTII